MIELSIGYRAVSARNRQLVVNMSVETTNDANYRLFKVSFECRVNIRRVLCILVMPVALLRRYTRCTRLGIFFA